ncbi:unnamed protein product [Paramecium sonneborni]|uniref:Transmembrane protein n=1 Tax=Paramecium sonneborni TaxID=65129 RepID=A0A8S1R6Q9_9CILI|nr:unnamed protein product [Paramecium sonneborni]
MTQKLYITESLIIFQTFWVKKVDYYNSCQFWQEQWSNLLTNFLAIYFSIRNIFFEKYNGQQMIQPQQQVLRQAEGLFNQNQFNQKILKLKAQQIKLLVWQLFIYFWIRWIIN